MEDLKKQILNLIKDNPHDHISVREDCVSIRATMPRHEYQITSDSGTSRHMFTANYFVKKKGFERYKMHKTYKNTIEECLVAAHEDFFEWYRSVRLNVRAKALYNIKHYK